MKIHCKWALAALCLLGFAEGQGTLAGKFVTASGGAVAGGTLVLQLSQAANVAGSWAVAATAASCATTRDGSVAGVPDPAVTPAVNAFVGGGTLAAGTYFVELAYTGPSATSSLAGPETTAALGAAGNLQVVAPALSPPGATGYAVYIGTASGIETLQGTAALGANYTQSAALVAGAALPASNNTVCTLLFNDELIPSFTWYTATLSDAAGNTLPGFPQNWYLAGLTADVSRLYPLASNPAVRFPMPILSAPPNLGTVQSLNSALNMNGQALQNSGNLGPGFFSAFWTGALPGAGTTLAAWTPNTAVRLQRIDINAQTAGGGGTQGTRIVVSDGTN
ncbi:MAG: hypothetical protein ACRD1E_09400, partial [Terriglobales bacterium]